MRWHARVVVGLLAAGASALASAPPRAAHAVENASALRVTDMTFVGSRGSLREVLVRSQRAVFRPDTRVADLQQVSAVVTEDAQGRSFTMTCARAELNIETNDFSAEGDVQGETGDGQRYWAPWVRYDHDEGVLYTDAPVRMLDATGSFRGDGFRYHVRERRFQLLGNVRVEQAP